ncbi:MAG TPA: hypothetical protein VFP32_01630 [Candidatus Saccharimonadales bacterium]|nr:hypothetical protein [Candidatus Saccharimonadales bacterium]
MPKRKDPRVTEAAKLRLNRQHSQYQQVCGTLLAQYKPTRLSRLIRDEELRLQN